MGTTSTAFLGNSQFSTDFQNVITRATAIASLPITQMTSDKTELSSEADALTGIDTKFKALQTAVQGISDSLGGSSFQSDVSDPSKVSVSLSTGAAEGNYAIDVVDPGTYATRVTSSAWVASSGATITYQLSLGGTNYTLWPTDNSASSVVAAINSQYGDKVHATLVNVGSATSPDPRISLQAVQLGDLKPGLLVGPTTTRSLQTQQTGGSDALATSQTTQSWAAAPGPPLSYHLSLGGENYSLRVADNNADSVVAAINQQYGDKVTAARVDVGAGGAHDYRITLTAVNPGDLNPDIIVGPADLQTQQATGALANYIVNNSGEPVSSTTRSVAIATGITVNLLAKDDGVPVNITVTRPTSALSDALSAFATAYNDAVDEVDKQHGQSSGALAGQSIVTDLSRVLSGMATYSNSSSGIGSLADLGLDLDATGHLTYRQFTLMASDVTNSAGVTAFLGSATSGFLQLATDSMSSVEDPTTGLLPTAEASVQNQITDITNSIADQQARVDDMTQNMQDQMAAADALISSMEQLYNYLSGMFQAMQTADNQYK